MIRLNYPSAVDTSSQKAIEEKNPYLIPQILTLPAVEVSKSLLKRDRRYLNAVWHKYHTRKYGVEPRIAW